VVQLKLGDFTMQFSYFLNWRHWLGAVKHPSLAIKIVFPILKHPNLLITTWKVDGLIEPNVGVLLYETVLKSKNNSVNVVEVGTYKGLLTIYLAKAAQITGKRVKSFDLFSELPGQLEECKNNLKASHVQDVVDLVIGDVRETMLPALGTTGFCVASIDIDVYEVIREILFQLEKIIRGGEIIIVHDIHLPRVRKAVNEFHERTENTVAENVIQGIAKLVVPSKRIARTTIMKL
jgi:predicted O-methyltransferase YrrM